MVYVKRIFCFFIMISTISCTLAPLSGSEAESLNIDISGGLISYIIMPEQECPVKLLGDTLVDSDVLHPSAKVCYYST